MMCHDVSQLELSRMSRGHFGGSIRCAVPRVDVDVSPHFLLQETTSSSLLRTYCCPAAIPR